MSASTDVLERVAPEFAGDSRADFALETAATLHSAAPWGAAYTLAMANFAAHILTMMDRAAGGGANGGEVTARSAGDLSESYASAARGTADDVLRETTYGRMYLFIRGTRAATGPQVIRPTV